MEPLGNTPLTKERRQPSRKHAKSSTRGSLGPYKVKGTSSKNYFSSGPGPHALPPGSAECPIIISDEPQPLLGKHSRSNKGELSRARPTIIDLTEDSDSDSDDVTEFPRKKALLDGQEGESASQSQPEHQWLQTVTRYTDRPLPDTITGFKYMSVLGQGTRGYVLEAGCFGEVTTFSIHYSPLSSEEHVKHGIYAIKVAEKLPQLPWDDHPFSFVGELYSDLTERRISLAKEAHVLAVLRNGGQHPNVTTLHAVYCSPSLQPEAIVCEAVIGKSLQKCISGYRANKSVNKDIYDYAIQIAKGVQYIHSKGVMHLNIESENVVMTTPTGFGNYSPMSVLKICDFGCAELLSLGKKKRILKGDDSRITIYRPPEIECIYPPESKDFSFYDHKADMYSLGMMIGSMLVIAPKHHQLTDVLKEIKEELINTDPAKRPSADQLVTMLEQKRSE